MTTPQAPASRKPFAELSTWAKRWRFRELAPTLGACEECGAPGAHRHHKDGDLNNATLQNMEVLCIACHRRRHSGRPAGEGPRRMLALRFPLELAEEFQALARRNDRSMTAEVERAMRAHLAYNREDR